MVWSEAVKKRKTTDERMIDRINRTNGINRVNGINRINGINGKKSRTRMAWKIVGLWMAVSFLCLFVLPKVSGEQGMFGLVTAQGAEEEKRPLKVVFPIVQGLSEKDECGHYSGLVVDFLNEIAKYTDWTYEYVEGTPEELLDGMMSKEYDLMGGTYYNEALTEYYAYPKYSMGSSRAILLARPDDTSIKSYDLTSLNGKTIGVYEKATDKILRLEDFLSGNDIQCELKYYTSEEMAKEANLYRFLENGEVDLLLGNDMETDTGFRIVTSFSSQPYYLVTAVGNTEILDGLNMALEKILDSDPNFAEERYAVNFPDVRISDMQFTEEERAFIQEKQKLLVAVVDDWHPLFCLENPNAHHEGVLPDLLEKISQFSGLEIVYVHASSYEEAIKCVQNGSADILGAYFDSDESAAALGLARTKPFVTMNNIVVKNKSVSYPDESLTGIILEGREMPAEVEVAEILTCSNVLEGLKLVNSGEADFIYGLASYLEPTIQEHHFSNLVPVTLTNNSEPIAFAISRPVKPELLTILNKSIGSLRSDEVNAILDRNLVSIGSSYMKLSDMIYANPVAFVAVLTAFLLLGGIVFLIVIRSKMKSAIMQADLERAEAESRARGDFLSRMSHEIRTPMNAIIGLTELTDMQAELPPQVRENLKKLRTSSEYLLSLINDILDMSRIDSGKMAIEQETFNMEMKLDELETMMENQAKLRQLTFICNRKVEHPWLSGDPLRLRQVLLNLLSNAFKFTPAGGQVRLSVAEEEPGEDSALYTFSVEDTGIGIDREDQERIFEAFEQLGANISKSEGTGLGLSISQNLVSLMGGRLNIQSEPEKGTKFYFTIRLSYAEPQEEEQKKLPEDEQDFSDVNVLLAEDNELNAEIAMELLKLRGIHAQWARDGKEAVERFEASEDGEFQLILMDIKMPEKDGGGDKGDQGLQPQECVLHPHHSHDGQFLQGGCGRRLRGGHERFYPKASGLGAAVLRDRGGAWTPKPGWQAMREPVAVNRNNDCEQEQK